MPAVKINHSTIDRRSVGKNPKYSFKKYFKFSTSLFKHFHLKFTRNKKLNFFTNKVSERTQKIASTIQHELAPVLHQYFEPDKYGIVTITDIFVLDDLSEARVSVDVPQKAQQFFDEIRKKSWKIAKEISPRLTIKKTPKLVFKPGQPKEEVQRVLKIMDNL